MTVPPPTPPPDLDRPSTEILEGSSWVTAAVILALVVVFAIMFATAGPRP